VKVFIFIFLGVIVLWTIAHAVYDIRRAWREYNGNKSDKK
jgi:hypothetical protein